jgi:hypothetical protein
MTRWLGQWAWLIDGETAMDSYVKLSVGVIVGENLATAHSGVGGTGSAEDSCSDSENEIEGYVRSEADLADLDLYSTIYIGIHHVHTRPILTMSWFGSSLVVGQHGVATLAMRSAAHSHDVHRACTVGG